MSNWLFSIRAALEAMGEKPEDDPIIAAKQLLAAVSPQQQDNAEPTEDLNGVLRRFQAAPVDRRVTPRQEM